MISEKLIDQDEIDLQKWQFDEYRYYYYAGRV